MASMFPVPAIIAKAKLGSFALAYSWGKTSPWLSDGARTPIVKKLQAGSIRGELALLLTSGEWLMSRLVDHGAEPWDDRLALAWRELLHPGSIDLEQLRVPDIGTAKVDGPIQEYLRCVRDSIDIAREFDGALHSYVEGGLRLVDHVMPGSAYRNWRKRCYERIAELSGKRTMPAIYAEIAKASRKRKLPDYEIKEEIVAQQGLAALWGPIVLRDDLLGDQPIADAERADRLAKFEQV